MICPQCRNMIPDDSKFCTFCGNVLSQPNVQNQQVVESIQPSEQVSLAQVPETPKVEPEKKEKKSINIDLKGNIKLLINVIKAPITTIESAKDSFTEFIKSISLFSIVVLLGTLIAMILNIIDVMFVSTFNYTTGGYDTRFDIGALANYNFFSVLATTLFLIAGAIILITTVYYIASIIIKKKCDFSKILGIVSLSMAPTLFISILISNILSVISYSFGYGISLIGYLYSFILIYESLNKELNLEGNKKIFFNLICLSIFLLVAFFIVYKILVSLMANGLKLV